MGISKIKSSPNYREPFFPGIPKHSINLNWNPVLGAAFRAATPLEIGSNALRLIPGSLDSSLYIFITKLATRLLYNFHYQNGFQSWITPWFIPP
jgi:hypothetical protein